MQYTVCSMQYAVCCMLYASAEMEYAVCSMLYIQYAVYTVCSMQYAVCSMQCGDLLGGAAVPCEGVEEVGKEDTVGGVVWEGLHPE